MDIYDLPPDAPQPGTPEANDLVVRGADGDPLSRPESVAMIEVESYERIIEGLKMAADSCMHLAKHESQHGQTWKDMGKLLDFVRFEACKLAGRGLIMLQHETNDASGNPYGWKVARDRLLEGLEQASGGMRQLAVCFRGDLRWSMMAAEVERHTRVFRKILARGTRALRPTSSLILPEHFLQ